MAGYVGHSKQEERELLQAIGVSSFEDLLAGVPESTLLQGPIGIPAGQSEEELRRLFAEYASRNYDPARTPSFLGAGLYDRIIPAAIRQITLRSEFYTAYTPYQAEVAQGTLASVFTFQSLLCELTGMDVANAGVYDGGSAAAEAVLLASAATGRNRVLVSAGLHPHHLDIVRAYSRGPGLAVEPLALEDGRTPLAALKRQLGDMAAGPVGAVVLQNPNFFGCIEDLEPLVAAIHEAGALAIVSADLVSLALLQTPADCGADLAVGEAQSCGNPPQFGGPLCGYLAARKELVRRLPGRLVAEAHDADGHRGFVLTLQTREQHIRREKATSNICTNNNLVALGVSLYLTLLGPRGLREVAEQSVQKAHHLHEKLVAIDGVRTVYGAPFFHEFAVALPVPAGELIEKLLREDGILAGLDLGRFDGSRGRELLIAVTEKRTAEEMDRFARAVRRVVAGR